ncbi:hypothetical protein SAMN06265222_12235 [Neorhodopirellula lusitana]|uniref:Uncharacterized protein n=1 Tax=Neorhodopirellula lusitana TaxID=445327 RepID=A0ABY1QPM5_9BACT|nr:hypothetical protein [Neorhodopirellula lusitana]SMP76894.1 hypothetical protein SAMN06265222_12235 [Neorhodopirellula lusitana]
MSTSYESQPHGDSGEATVRSTTAPLDWAWLIERVEEQNDLEIELGSWLDDELMSLESQLSEFAVSDSDRNSSRSS